MAQVTADPPGVKLLLKDGSSSSDLSPVPLSEQSLASTSTGRGKSELGRKRGEGKSPWRWQGLFAFLGFSWLGAEMVLTPQSRVCCLSGSPAPRQCLRCFTQCHLCGSTAPVCEPLTSPSFGDFLPWLLIVCLHFCWNISSLRCAKPLITCLHVHALAETPSKGSNNKNLFICLLFFVYFKYFLPSSPPPSPQ